MQSFTVVSCTQSACKILRITLYRNTMALLVVALRFGHSPFLHEVSAFSSQSQNHFMNSCRYKSRHDVKTCSTSRFPGLRRCHYHSSVSCRLNRFLFDPSEVDCALSSEVPTITLPKQDYRTIHSARILGIETGDTVRAGLVGKDGKHGLMTDKAMVEWISEGTQEAKPQKNGDPRGSLRFRLHELQRQPEERRKMPVSLILALPRPLQLGRMLPMISQLGVDQLVLTSSYKVPRDYFGSHLLRQPEALNERLIEGLCQAGDVSLPKVHIARNLRRFLDNELDDIFPKSDFSRVIAHPQRYGSDGLESRRMRNVLFPTESNRIVLAVGPEGGWLEPDELQHFRRHGFQQVSLGSRVFRSDVAVISLLSLAHDVCTTRDEALRNYAEVVTVDGGEHTASDDAC